MLRVARYSRIGAVIVAMSQIVAMKAARVWLIVICIVCSPFVHGVCGAFSWVLVMVMFVRYIYT